MSLMTEALERISEHLQISTPNRTREEVEKQLAFFPFYLAEEVYEYYQWAGAPIGFHYAEEEGGSTYQCLLNTLIGEGEDLIEFSSLETAKYWYCSGFEKGGVHGVKNFLFVASENTSLVIAGSETPTDVSPVLESEEGPGSERLWFPSLTNMMLAIADAVDAFGTIMPASYLGSDSGERGKRERSERWRIAKEITKKYGSPHGTILTN